MRRHSRLPQAEFAPPAPRLPRASPVAPNMTDPELRDDLSCSSLFSAPPLLHAADQLALDEGAPICWSLGNGLSRSIKLWKAHYRLYRH